MGSPGGDGLVGPQGDQVPLVRPRRPEHRARLRQRSTLRPIPVPIQSVPVTPRPACRLKERQGLSAIVEQTSVQILADGNPFILGLYTVRNATVSRQPNALLT